MSDLLDDLLTFHKQGTQHVMDGGRICVGCGDQWPCRTYRIITKHALASLRKDDHA